MIRPGDHRDRPGRSGITLTEILIGIMILGVGLVSIATLFPIGLLRLREAQRQSRSALLFESAAADMAARNLVNAQSFVYADLLNLYAGFSSWYPCQVSVRTPDGLFNPLLQDAASYGGDVYAGAALTDLVGLDAGNSLFHIRGSAGLPFAYDPLWRYKMTLYPQDPAGAGVVPEARFGSGIGFVRNDPDGGAPSAHGLQRLTNFNGRVRSTYTDGAGNTFPIYFMQTTNNVPSIFVSPEDVVWNEMNNPSNLSPILPDRTISGTGASVNDWRFSWIFTGRLGSSSNAATFEGDLVIYENRAFDLESMPSPLDSSVTIVKPADETVVEAVFGYSTNVAAFGPVGYGSAADRTVLLRWPATMADPIVKTGDWICDVTYERQQLVALNTQGTVVQTDDTGRFVGVPNPLNGGKWDNTPAQRAFWYQVVKTTPAVVDPGFAGDPNVTGGFRRMIVQVNSALRARTPMTAGATPSPAVVNAALIAPHVVNVIPQTIVIH
ncbi:type IV pilus modification PilV family protein [Paludisphaera soli]|uniref:type IV pilus modification PilV family protein n=1 Tax=Paludisphaera soli TaxID=2712865 RepID=UPI0013EBEA00|nr:hypothetical protein [Paludisphaera soli]